MSDTPTQVPGQQSLLDVVPPTPLPPRRLPPFQRHSSTSREAAVSVYGTVASQRERVFRYIEANGPCSDDAVIAGLGLDGSSVRPRRIELFEAGRITQAGECLTRKGRRAVAWQVVE